MRRPAGTAAARCSKSAATKCLHLERGQTVGRLAYEPLAAPPDSLYGAALGSNYQAQGLKLSKHFRAPAEGAA